MPFGCKTGKSLKLTLHSEAPLYNSPQTQKAESLEAVSSIFKGKKKQARRTKNSVLFY